MSFKRNGDIPGYIWSPRRSRYFKDLPASVTGFSQIENVCTSLSEVNGSQSYIPKNKNLLHCIASRQAGCIDACVFEREVLSLRLDGLHTSDGFSFPYDTRCDVEFLQGGADCLYGLWKTGPRGVLGQINHGLAPNPPYIRFEVKGTKILSDLCEVQDNGLLCIYNAATPMEGKAVIRILGADDRRIEFFSQTLRCCTWSSTHNSCAIGIDKGVAFFNIGEAFDLIERKLKWATICAVEYDTNDSGNILECGNTQGQIFVLDFRNPNHFEHQVTSGNITDIKILSQRYDSIFSTDGGIICRFDFRQNGKVHQFHGHTPMQGRTRLSVSEKHDLLCATGSDGVTRLWSLQLGGYPLKCIPPEEPGRPCRSWLVGDAAKCLIYIVQGNKVKVYEFQP